MIKIYQYSLNLIKNYKLQEFIRFVIVGILATGINYIVYYFLQKIVNENIAFTLGYIISFCFNFFASNIFTFKTSPNIENGFRFGLAHLTNYLIQILLLNFFILVKVPKIYAPFPVYIIAIPVNFLIVRYALKRKINN